MQGAARPDASIVPNMSPICVIDITDLPFLPKVAPKPVWNAIAGRSFSFPSTSSVYCS